MADDIVNRDVADPWQEVCDLRDEIDRLRALCYEAQAFISHDKNCAALMGWAKDCSCGHDEMWSKLNV